MKTELTFKYRRQLFRKTITCHNPSSAGAVFLIRHPEIDRSQFTIINCIGICTTAPSRPNYTFQ